MGAAPMMMLLVANKITPNVLVCRMRRGFLTSAARDPPLQKMLGIQTLRF
jgi:hypothetical protein